MKKINLKWYIRLKIEENFPTLCPTFYYYIINTINNVDEMVSRETEKGE